MCKSTGIDSFPQRRLVTSSMGTYADTEANALRYAECLMRWPHYYMPFEGELT